MLNFKDKLKSKKILIYGFGKTGKSCFNFLKKNNQIKIYDDNHKTIPKNIKNNYFIKNNYLNIKYFVDKKNSNIGNKVDEYKIKPISTLKENSYYILIASSAYYEEIYSEILNLGIKPSRILDQIYS